MEKVFRNTWLVVALALAGCSGGGSDSGAASGSATPFTGEWFIVATLNVNIAGTATLLTDTTRFVVGASGNAVITETDSECGLKIYLNDNILTYESTCIFTATSGDTSAPCVLTLRAQAQIRGPQGRALVSDSFGPKTEVCRGVAASYTGNLVGGEGSGPSTGTGTSTGTTGTSTGTTGTSTGTTGNGSSG